MEPTAKTLAYFLIVWNFGLVSSISSAAIKASDVTSYSNWKSIEDAYAKDCQSDVDRFKKSANKPGPLMPYTERSLRNFYLPNFYQPKSTYGAHNKLEPSLLEKLNQLNLLAKAKALDQLKLIPNSTMTPDRIEKTNGFALAEELKLAPEDFLRSFDYLKACKCRRSTANIAVDEATYNKLSFAEFEKLKEVNIMKCFIEAAQP